jgi:membrane-bound serine protease (ClpP class)
MSFTPTVAYGLAVGGILAIYYECCRPGTVIAGAAGSVLLLLGLSRLVSFGITREGALLTMGAIVLLMAESWWRWPGPPGLAGALLLAFAATRLTTQMGVSWPAALVLSMVLGCATVILGSLAIQGYIAKHSI